MQARFLALVLVLAAAAARAGWSRGSASGDDPIGRAQEFVRVYGSGARPVPIDVRVGLPQLFAELRILQASVPEQRHAVFIALLDLAALADPDRTDGASARHAPTDGRDEASRLAYQALGRALDSGGDLPHWIASTVLTQTLAHPAARRRAALEALVGRHLESMQLAIMGAARDADAGVRDAAMRALVGWPDEGVHCFMLMQLTKAEQAPDWVRTTLIYRHFGSVALDPAGRAASELFEFVRNDLTAAGWRDALRALRLLDALDDAHAVPALIEALDIWASRRERGQGRRRIEDEIHRQLKRRSGRSIAPLPERWASWWKAVQSGQLPLGGGDDGKQVTRAAFFGLRPVTDHVAFILDRSGSMDTPFGGGATRYQEALRQMSQFLRDLGPQTRFRVVLFDSELRVWKPRLVEATPANLDAAERWVGYQHPGGGTVLRPAVEHVLRVGARGQIDLRLLEEDTVIVLCDGATTDGSSWVDGLLERVGDEACVTFHCVQIGSSGDGTLEALAERSGGQFVRVDG